MPDWNTLPENFRSHRKIKLLFEAADIQHLLISTERISGVFQRQLTNFTSLMVLKNSLEPPGSLVDVFQKTEPKNFSHLETRPIYIALLGVKCVRKVYMIKHRIQSAKRLLWHSRTIHVLEFMLITLSPFKTVACGTAANRGRL